MTTAEANELVAMMIRWWPHAAERLAAPEVAETLGEQLHDLRPEHARAAVEAWLRDGQQWPPTAGQIRGRLADLILDVPDWSEVKAALTGNAPVAEDAPQLPDRCPYGECDGRGLVFDWAENVSYPCRCRPERQAILRARRNRHPLVAEFVRRVGSLEIADLDDRVASAQVRRQWEEFVERMRRHVTHSGMDPAGLPELERVARRELTGPRQINAAVLLGIPQDREEAA